MTHHLAEDYDCPEVFPAKVILTLSVCVPLIEQLEAHPILEGEGFYIFRILEDNFTVCLKGNVELVTVVSSV
jgi:hypothetical protein